MGRRVHSDIPILCSKNPFRFENSAPELFVQKYWKTDKPWFKTYIFIIWIFDTVQEILVVQFSYMYFVKDIVDSSWQDRLPRHVFSAH